MEEKKTLKEIIKEAGSDGNFTCDLCMALDNEGCDGGPWSTVCTEAVAELLIEAIEREFIERPSFEDGKPVQFEDEYVMKNGEHCRVTSLGVSPYGFAVNPLAKDSIFHLELGKNERVKRPKPQAIGADGKPIKVGDTVYGIENGIEFRVTAVYADMETNNVTARSANEYGQAGYCNLKAKTLTHEQPDTLERIEDDATMSPLVYCEDIMELPHCREEFDQATLIELMVADLLARQRKVLERGQR